MLYSLSCSARLLSSGPRPLLVDWFPGILLWNGMRVDSRLQRSLKPMKMRILHLFQQVRQRSQPRAYGCPPGGEVAEGR